MRLLLALAALGVALALLVCGALWDSLGVVAVPMIAGLIGLDTYYAFFGERLAKEARRAR
jgi:hypothetical protein